MNDEGPGIATQGSSMHGQAPRPTVRLPRSGSPEQLHHDHGAGTCMGWRLIYSSCSCSTAQYGISVRAEAEKQ
jgi:hypothetical protein